MAEQGEEKRKKTGLIYELFHTHVFVVLPSFVINAENKMITGGVSG